MYIIFNIDKSSTRELEDIERILIRNNVTYHKHTVAWRPFGQRYLWVKDHKSYIQAKQIIKEFYMNSPDFNIFTEKDYSIANKWYLLLMALFILIYLIIIFLSKIFN